ncbi:MAG: 2-C-methyl-D-erythritol 4-phosphate cytidylyltransferase [Actinomycetota bacterium]|nr:2-C-methyl-D-erythritol 4-phosphate cytidylyltransferase [Actinomycetota bacterium]
MNLAIIVAAGKGKRMGLKGGKQFITLLDKPLLAYTLVSFQQAASIDSIVIVTTQEDHDKSLSVTEKFNIVKVDRVVIGGEERQDSVYNGLKAAKDFKKVDVVVVHDGARPLVEPELIDRVVDGVAGCHGAIAGIPAKDTIKLVSGDQVFKTIDRTQLWQIQTPQAFLFDALLAAHEKAKADKFYGTDDSVLVERIGGKVRVVMGSDENIKVTTPTDLALAEAILRNRESAKNMGQ